MTFSLAHLIFWMKNITLGPKMPLQWLQTKKLLIFGKSIQNASNSANIGKLCQQFDKLKSSGKSNESELENSLLYPSF